MCETCGPETIHHVRGERPISREHCFCRCHDREENGHLICGTERSDELAAVTACVSCRWAHVVAFSTDPKWWADERHMARTPTPTEGDPR